MMQTILERWQLTPQELTLIIDENPSLRGFMLGYIAEYKLRALLTASSEVSKLEKPDDHARGAAYKNDLIITYRNRPFSFEVKSLQTNSIKKLDDNTLIGKVQVDASDRREVILPNGERLNTTCLVAGEFDILAINLFHSVSNGILHSFSIRICHAALTKNTPKVSVNICWLHWFLSRCLCSRRLTRIRLN